MNDLLSVKKAENKLENISEFKFQARIESV